MNMTLAFPDGRRVSIRAGRGLLADLGKTARRLRPARAVVVADAGVPARWASAAVRSLAGEGIPAVVLRFPSGESSKRLAVLERLARACARAGLGRDGILVGLGGGVACDLTGCLAALYLRGIPLILLPTTLLAQADAAVGGKCGVDLPEGKNLLGAVRQPAAVLADLDTLASLSPRRRREGLAEIVKCGILDGAASFGWMESRARALRRGAPDALERALGIALRVKADHVALDEHETRGLRERLNLGHTVGHALEAAAGYGRLAHGEAVAIGLVAACRVAARTGVLGEPGLEGRVAVLLGALGLPVRIPPGLSTARVLALARRDKKSRRGTLRMILPVGLGRTVSRVVPEARLAEALDALRPGG